MKKYKATGCARFFVVMLILAPLAYIGASIYNGQDPIQNIKDLFGMSGTTEQAYEPPAEDGSEKRAVNDESGVDNGELEQLRETNSKLVEENKYLKIQIKSLEQELESLKNPPSQDQ